MAAKTYLKIVVALLLAAAIFVTGAAIVFPRLLDLETCRARILSMAQSALNRRVSYQTVSISWRFVPSVVFRGITVAEKSGDAPFLQAEQLTFTIDLLHLLRKEVRLRGVIVQRPTLLLSRDREGVFNVEDLFAAGSPGTDVQLKGVRIQNGRIRFIDRLHDSRGFTTELDNLDLYVNRLERGKISEFRIATLMTGGGREAELSFSGTARIPGREEPLNETQLDIKVSAKNLDIGGYWPYYGRFLPCEPLAGVIDIEQVFTGTPLDFTTKGHLGVKELRVEYPAVFHSILTPREVSLAYEVERTPRKLAMKSLDLNVDGLRVTGSCALDDLHSKDPHIDARAAMAPFRLEEFRQYIPYGVIPKGTADFIEQRIRGGIFRLDEGRLDGRLSRIAHMGSGDNYNALLVRARVEKGLITMGPQVPPFGNIRGTLEMRGKDFSLIGMTGTFGSAPFTLEGKITDYPLATPASYPFAMDITPGEAEVAWLSRQDASSGMAFRGKSQLRLSGSGTASDYRITGAWDLHGADYRYRQILHKPVGIANRLRLNLHLGTNGAQLTDVRYELPPLEIDATAAYRYNDPASLTFALNTNRFTADQVVTVLPQLRKYHPSGSLQAALSGSGNPASPDAVRMKGSIVLDNFSLQPFAQIKPLEGITGTINITEAALQTEQLTGRVGGSSLAVKGLLTGRTNPTASLVFSSPQLKPEDFGFQASGQTPEVRNVAGNVSLKDDTLTIASLSGEVNRSQFKANGEVRDAAGTQIALRVDFPHLAVEDLESLAGLRRAGRAVEPMPDISLRAEVTAAAGSFRENPFEHLATALSLRKERLDIHSFSAGLFGGNVSGSGQADFAATGGPEYRANYKLEHIDADRLLGAAGLPRKLSGQFAAEGDFSARGSSREELAKSARAAARMHLRDGAITLPSPKGDKGEQVPYGSIDANLSLQGKTLTVHELNAALFEGTVSASGVADFAAEGGPAYRAHYRLDHVAADQLLRTAGFTPRLGGLLAAEGDVTARGSRLEELASTARGNAEIVLDNGVMRLTPQGGQKTDREFPIKKALMSLTFGGKKLSVQKGVIEAFGGIASGKGGADFNPADGPAYHLDFYLSDVNADEFFDTFDVTNDITGRLTLQTELTARGDNATALKKTLGGSLTVHLKKGVIRKYGFISTVFSILNVSQVVDFRVPDLTSFGMPYDHIDGTYVFDKGTVSTTDLSIHSPSLNMTVVGSANLVTRDLDVKIGVQPFQTFGRIINRIPVIGWILTGGKKRVVVVYYEAKGKWDDPTISSTTTTALPAGVYNIFKRVFSLPEEIIDQPGKVFLGS